MNVVMNQVAIVGAGHIGYRHLQGIVKARQHVSVHVVDPLENARRLVEIFTASLEAELLPPIHIHTSVESLPANIDLVVIATSANERLEAIERITSRCNVRYMILEKFLFNDSDHYARASSIITTRGIRAWVNTPRRTFEVYRSLRDQTCHGRLLQLCVDGGDWGLCCNSIHFVDLAQFLSGSSRLQLLRTSLDPGVLPSKRKGYLELTGEVSGEVGPTSFILRSISGSKKSLTLTLHYERQTVFIAENIGSISRVYGDHFDSKEFQVPYQSEMTGAVADQLLTTGASDLTPFADSVSAHLALLRVFAQQAGSITGSRWVCNIT
jgi:predicted dehydrogenase